MRDVMNPPDRLTIVQTDAMVIITAGDGHVERLSPDGKKVKDETTKIERRTKWDGDKLVCELTGLGSRKITETYFLDPEHKQLHVTVRLDNPNRPSVSTRIYDVATL